MKIYVRSDIAGESVTTQVDVRGNSTSQLLRSVADAVFAQVSDILVTLRDDSLRLRVVSGWDLSLYPFKNGSLCEVLLIKNVQLQRSRRLKEHDCRSNSESTVSPEERVDYSFLCEEELEKLAQEARKGNLVGVSLLLQKVNETEHPLKQLQRLLNEKGRTGRNCLHWAIHSGSTDMVSLLLIKGADCESLTQDDYSPLQLAVALRALEIASLLLNKCDPNRVTSHGTALHCAVKSGNIPAVNLLMKHGARSDRQDFNGNSVIDSIEDEAVSNTLSSIQRVPTPFVPNIGQGIVLRKKFIGGHRQTQFTINCFRNQLSLGEETHQISTMTAVDFVREKGFGMKEELWYLKTVANKKNVVFAVKHKEIADRWLQLIKQSIVFVGLKYTVGKQQQAVEILDDQHNRVEIRRRKVEVVSPSLKQSILDLHQDPQRTLCRSQILLGSVVGVEEFSTEDDSHHTPTSQQNTPTFQQNAQNQMNSYKTLTQHPLRPPQQLFIDSLTDSRSFKKQEARVQPSAGLRLKDFRVGRVIGRGSRSVVHYCRGIKREFALKVMRKKTLIASNQMKSVVEDASTLRRLRHPFLTKLHFAFQTPKHLFLVLHLCSHGTLLDLIHLKDRLQQRTATFVICQLILALEELGREGLVAKNMTPTHILIDKTGYIKLSGFLPGQNKSASFHGTPQKSKRESHPPSTDIYRLGCVLYQMLVGHSYDQKATLKFPSHITQMSCSLISRLLDADQRRRPTLPEVKQHPCFKSISWVKMLARDIEVPLELQLREKLWDESEMQFDDADYDGMSDQQDRKAGKVAHGVGATVQSSTTVTHPQKSGKVPCRKAQKRTAVNKRGDDALDKENRLLNMHDQSRKRRCSADSVCRGSLPRQPSCRPLSPEELRKLGQDRRRYNLSCNSMIEEHKVRLRKKSKRPSIPNLKAVKPKQTVSVKEMKPSLKNKGEEVKESKSKHKEYKEHKEHKPSQLKAGRSAIRNSCLHLQSQARKKSSIVAKRSRKAGVTRDGSVDGETGVGRHSFEKPQLKRKRKKSAMRTHCVSLLESDECFNAISRSSGVLGSEEASRRQQDRPRGFEAKRCTEEVIPRPIETSINLNEIRYFESNSPQSKDKSLFPIIESQVLEQYPTLDERQRHFVAAVLLIQRKWRERLLYRRVFKERLQREQSQKGQSQKGQSQKGQSQRDQVLQPNKDGSLQTRFDSHPNEKGQSEQQMSVSGVLVTERAETQRVHYEKVHYQFLEVFPESEFFLRQRDNLKKEMEERMERSAALWRQGVIKEQEHRARRSEETRRYNEEVQRLRESKKSMKKGYLCLLQSVRTLNKGLRRVCSDSGAMTLLYQRLSRMEQSLQGHTDSSESLQRLSRELLIRREHLHSQRVQQQLEQTAKKQVKEEQHSTRVVSMRVSLEEEGGHKEQFGCPMAPRSQRSHRELYDGRQWHSKFKQETFPMSQCRDQPIPRQLFSQLISFSPRGSSPSLNLPSSFKLHLNTTDLAEEEQIEPTTTEQRNRGVQRQQAVLFEKIQTPRKEEAIVEEGQKGTETESGKRRSCWSKGKEEFLLQCIITEVTHELYLQLLALDRSRGEFVSDDSYQLFDEGRIIEVEEQLSAREVVLKGAHRVGEEGRGREEGRREDFRERKTKKGPSDHIEDYVDQLVTWVERGVLSECVWKELNKTNGLKAVDYLKFLRDYEMPTDNYYFPILSNEVFLEWEQQFLRHSECLSARSSGRTPQLTTIFHRCIFQSFLNLLESRRLFGERGMPFPWDAPSSFGRAVRKREMPSIWSEVRKEFKDIAAVRCGIIEEKHFLTTEEEMEEAHQLNEDRIIDMIEKEFRKSPHAWYELDQLLLQVKLEFSLYLNHWLWTEVANELASLRNSSCS